jgi:hypothetical protein
MLKIMLFCIALAGAAAVACDSCETSVGDPGAGGTVGLTAGIGDLKYRWSLDTTFDYRNWDRINPSVAMEINERENGHTHSNIDDWFVTQRVGYAVNEDLAVGISQNFRHLRNVNIDDPLNLGRHQFAAGFGDLEVDVKWRFKRQRDGGFPVDLSLFGFIKPPTGQTRERTQFGALFDAEDMPGTGSWDGGFGMSATKRWGGWGASGAMSYTVKGEGSQDFKAGDVLRVSLGASRKLPQEPLGWKLYPSLGVQGVVEFKGKDRGEIDRNHGGETIFVVPGFAAKPLERLTIGVSVPLPVYEELHGFHQKQDFSVQVGIGVRF